MMDKSDGAPGNTLRNALIGATLLSTLAVPQIVYGASGYGTQLANCLEEHTNCPGCIENLEQRCFAYLDQEYTLCLIDGHSAYICGALYESDESWCYELGTYESECPL